jgi:hypothetical protein
MLFDVVLIDSTPLSLSVWILQDFLPATHTEERIRERTKEGEVEARESWS